MLTQMLCFVMQLYSVSINIINYLIQDEGISTNILIYSMLVTKFGIMELNRLFQKGHM